MSFAKWTLASLSGLGFWRWRRSLCSALSGARSAPPNRALGFASGMARRWQRDSLLRFRLHDVDGGGRRRDSGVRTAAQAVFRIAFAGWLRCPEFAAGGVAGRVAHLLAARLGAAGVQRDSREDCRGEVSGAYGRELRVDGLPADPDMIVILPTVSSWSSPARRSSRVSSAASRGLSSRSCRGRRLRWRLVRTLRRPCAWRRKT